MAERSIVRIHVRLKIGSHMMAASDDPLFLGLRGDCGREFRLALAKGKSLRKDSEDHFVLGAPDDPATNVAHPEQNDPTVPSLDPDAITGLYLRKGFDPIPNVRAMGEMDDRLLIDEAEVEIDTEGEPKAMRFSRSGPIWMGLICGLRFELPRTA